MRPEICLGQESFGRCRIRTCDFHGVKAASVGGFIDGKGVTNRLSC